MTLSGSVGCEKRPRQHCTKPGSPCPMIFSTRLPPFFLPRSIVLSIIHLSGVSPLTSSTSPAGFHPKRRTSRTVNSAGGPGGIGGTGGSGGLGGRTPPPGASSFSFLSVFPAGSATPSIFLNSPLDFQNTWKSQIALARLAGHDPSGPGDGDVGQSSLLPPCDLAM